jgi:hypothetical protein
MICINTPVPTKQSTFLDSGVNQPAMPKRDSWLSTFLKISGLKLALLDCDVYFDAALLHNAAWTIEDVFRALVQVW